MKNIRLLLSLSIASGLALAAYAGSDKDKAADKGCTKMACCAEKKDGKSSCAKDGKSCCCDSGDKAKSEKKEDKAEAKK